MRITWHNRVPVLKAVPVLSLIILLCAPSVESAELRNRLLAGYDSFIDRFTLIEDDTTETVHEYYTALDNFFLTGSGPTKFTLRNIFKYGNQTVDNDLNAVLNAGSRKSLLMQFRGNLRLKYFREGSDYEFGNDYLQSNLHLKLGRQFGERWYVISKSRVEVTDFEERTQFDYDYHYFDTGLGVETGSYFNKYARVFAALGRREAPDTTDMSFNRFHTEAEARLNSGSFSFDLSVFGDRREYEGMTRSDYWFIFSTGGLTWTGISGRSVALRLESELLYYDTQTRTWFNNHFFRGSVRTRIPVSGITNIHIEPRYATMRCESFLEERYSEGSVVLGFDIMGSEKYWMTFSWEPGYRSYNLEDNPIYSDFRFNRLSLMASGTFGKRYGANIFLSHDPEKHTRRTDDFSIMMASVSFSIKF
jgi:hypothetical protein